MPESPRWLVTHGRHAEAEQTVADIERRAEEGGAQPEPKDENDVLTIHPRASFGFGLIFSDHDSASTAAAACSP